MVIYENKIESSFKNVDICVKEVLVKLADYEKLADESTLFKVSFVLRELMNNSVEHGNGFDISKLIYCNISYDNNNLFIEIKDEGKGFSVEDSYGKNMNFNHRERHRGLRLIEDLEFSVKVDKNKIKLELKVE